MNRLVMHLDLDAFYAAIEQRDHPEWRGRPLVVGAEPGGRGVVATCSYEARRHGVHSAMPIAEAARRLPADTVYVRPRMAHYSAVSRQVMTVLDSLSPVVEQVSIDEAYLDLSGLDRLFGTPEAIGRRAKQAIADAVGLTASVGIGPNRLIAKLASEHRKPDGLTVVTADAVRAFLDPKPLTVLRGVGERTAPRLQRLGLVTVGDVRRLGLEPLRRALGAQAGTALYRQSLGQASVEVRSERARKSVSKETTFERDVEDARVLRETLRWAAQEVGRTARAESLEGPTITLKIRFRGFETHTRSRTLDRPTAEDRVIFQTAWRLYQGQPWQGRAVRLIGIGLSGWQQRDDGQPDLFADQPAAGPRPERAVDRTIDSIREKFGPGALQRGLRRRSPK